MTAEAFDVLVEIVRPAVEVNEIRSMASTPQSTPIFPELVVTIGIRYLCGGSHHDITSYIGVSDSSFYRCRDLFLDAILSSEDPRLAIHWPESTEQYEEIAKAFRAKSTHEIMRNCVGALDGLLIQIRRPTLKETDSADAYQRQPKRHTREWSLQFLLVAVAHPHRGSLWIANNQVVHLAWRLDPLQSVNEFHRHHGLCQAPQLCHQCRQHHRGRACSSHTDPTLERPK